MAITKRWKLVFQNHLQSLLEHMFWVAEGLTICYDFVLPFLVLDTISVCLIKFLSYSCSSKANHGSEIHFIADSKESAYSDKHFKKYFTNIH